MTFTIAPNVVNSSTYVELPAELDILWETDIASRSATLAMGGTYGLEITAQLAAVNALIAALTEVRAALATEEYAKGHTTTS